MNKHFILLILSFTILFSGCPLTTAPDKEETQHPEEASARSIGLLEFSHPAGFYTENIMLELSSAIPDAVIYYTLDGSIPNPEKIMSDEEWDNSDITTRTRTYIYSEPIDIGEYMERENDISNIPSRPEALFSPPGNNLQKAVIVRAVSAGRISTSNIVTNTYLIDDLGREKYKIPVISISTDRGNLFDYYNGIYVSGVNFNPSRSNPFFDGIWTGNYYGRGYHWEKIAHFEYIDISNTQVLSHDVGVRIHGGWSRNTSRKNIRLYFRGQYGLSSITYPFYQTKAHDLYKRILLRNTGSMNDVFMHTLVHHLPFETQHYQPAVLFINGEYWGLYGIRDRYDKYHFAFHYGVHEDDVQVVMGGGIPADLVDRIGHIDQSITLSSFTTINDHIDLYGFLDYMTAQLYSGNHDWPDGNSKWWRHTGNPDIYDTRWKVLFYDLDAVSHSFNSLSHLDNRKNTSRIARLFWNLLSIKEIRNIYFQSLSMHLNSTFHPDRTLAHIRSIMEEIGSSYSSRLENHARQRPSIFRTHMIDFFDEITGEADLTVAGLPSDSDVTIHSIVLHEDTPGVFIEEGEWTGIMFTGTPITIHSKQADLLSADIQGDFDIESSTEDVLVITIHGDVSIQL